MMQIGLGISSGQGLPVAASAPLAGMVAPGNLFTTTQAGFASSDHIDFRSNWEISDGRLRCLGLSGNDARLGLDAPLTAGRAYMCVFDPTVPQASLKMNLGGDGVVNGRSINSDWQGFQFFPAAAVTGNYLRVQAKPASGFTGAIDDIALYDLSSVDPHSVACDVVVIGGDSNAANATSDFVTRENRETAYDPRIWYMPCLRVTGSYGAVGNVRHQPFPMIEPCATVEAQRMSPCHAAAAELVGWSAARGRPLLVMALGEPGSGLMNTEDWRPPARQSGGPYSNPSTASRMWNEMVAMKAAVEALGPPHEVVGAIWSLGQNDGFNTDSPEGYDIAHTPEYQAFFAEVRNLFGAIPMVLNNIAQHAVEAADGSGSPGFGSYRQIWLGRFDAGSGHENAIANFRVVQPPPGNPFDLQDTSDPHYNAAGMQANGRQAGATLRAMLAGGGSGA